MPLRLRCLLLLAAGLAARPAAAQLPADKVYTEFEGIALPELLSPDGTVLDPQAVVQRRLQLPPGTPTTADQRVFVRFVVEKDGSVSRPRITQSVSEVADAAVLAAVRRLSRFRPGTYAGQPVRVALAMGIWPGGVPATAVTAAQPLPNDLRSDTIEARTLRRGIVEAAPGGDASSILWQALPVSFAAGDKPVTYAWHPNAYGPQLFFSAPGRPGQPQEYECLLYVFDPIDPNTYAVQAVDLGSQGDYTSLAALFFADANHDGKKDLLALTQCSLRDRFWMNGQWLTGRQTHYQTTALYYRGLNAAGRPQYEQQYLADLDEISSAAEVRRLLAAPPKRPAAPAAKAGPVKKR